MVHKWHLRVTHLLPDFSFIVISKFINNAMKKMSAKSMKMSASKGKAPAKMSLMEKMKAGKAAKGKSYK